MSLPENIFEKGYIENLWNEFNSKDIYTNAYKLWIIGSIGGWSDAHSIKWD